MKNIDKKKHASRFSNIIKSSWQKKKPPFNVTDDSSSSPTIFVLRQHHQAPSQTWKVAKFKCWCVLFNSPISSPLSSDEISNLFACSFSYLDRSSSGAFTNGGELSTSSSASASPLSEAYEKEMRIIREDN